MSVDKASGGLYEGPAPILGDGCVLPNPNPDYVAPAIDEKAPVPPCCAAMRSAVITAYRATWQDNLRLIGQREYQRGLADGRAGR